MGLWSDFFSLTKFTCRPRAAGVIIAHLVTEKQWFPLFSDAEKAISVYMAKTCKCRCPIIGQIVPNKTQFRGRKYQYHARSASRMYKSTRGDDSDVIRSTILTPSSWRYSMLLRCNVVNLLIHSLANCCVWNYIRSANKPWHKIFRFPQFSSLFDHAKYASNMVASVMSLHLVYTCTWGAVTSLSSLS